MKLISYQGRIGKLKASEPPDRSNVFAKLVLEGQINSALRFLSETTSGGVLSLTDEVMSQLKQNIPIHNQPNRFTALRAY